jgi:hypothetical protein
MRGRTLTVTFAPESSDPNLQPDGAFAKGSCGGAPKREFDRNGPPRLQGDRPRRQRPTMASAHSGDQNSAVAGAAVRQAADGHQQAPEPVERQARETAAFAGASDVTLCLASGADSSVGGSLGGARANGERSRW